MKEEMEQFERRLSGQRLRRVPAEWREEILVAASRDHLVESRGPERLRRPFLSSLSFQLSSIFWPHPAAWAGLAAVWVFILAVDFSTRDRVAAMTQGNAPASVEVIIEVRLQQRLLAELLGPHETRDADRQKVFLPRPRSQRAEMLSV